MSNLPPISFRPGAPQQQQYTSTFNPVPGFPGQNYNPGSMMPNPAFGVSNFGAPPMAFPGQQPVYGAPSQFAGQPNAFNQPQAAPATHRNTMLGKSALNFNQVDRSSINHLANL